MSHGEAHPEDTSKDKPANVAPDAVTDPNEKTDGKPGLRPQGGATEEKGGATEETDPGGG